MAYHAVGITDIYLNYKADEMIAAAKKSEGFDPFSALFSFIDRAGLEIELALTNPKVQAFMREAGIKAEEAKVEAARREKAKKEKSSMLKWGAGVVVIGFLILRKK
jgi:hypothetical protein